MSNKRGEGQGERRGGPDGRGSGGRARQERAGARGRRDEAVRACRSKGKPSGENNNDKNNKKNVKEATNLYVRRRIDEGESAAPAVCFGLLLA